MKAKDIYEYYHGRPTNSLVAWIWMFIGPAPYAYTFPRLKMNNEQANQKSDDFMRQFMTDAEFEKYKATKG